VGIQRDASACPSTGANPAPKPRQNFLSAVNGRAIACAANWENPMHGIDRIQPETEFEAESFEDGPFEAEGFDVHHVGASFHETRDVLGKAEQLELASDLLAVGSEAALDRLLRELIGRAGQTIGLLISLPEGRAIGGFLKGIAKRILSGVEIGRDTPSDAGQDFGLELEGLSSEDREFEIARHYVNFAGEAVKNLMLDPASPDPGEAAHAAVVEAAKTYAPGLLLSHDGIKTRPNALPAGDSGRWVRHGDTIVLYGIDAP